jgi:hypothetical protein
MNATPRIAARTLLLVAALLAALPLAAQNECVDRTAQPRSAGEAEMKLRQLQAADCLGDTKCATPLCNQAAAWMPSHDVQGAVELLTAIRNSAAGAGKSGNLTHLTDRIDAWIVVVGNDAAVKSAPGQWRYEAGGGGLFLETPYEIRIDKTIEDACAGGAGPCAAAFMEAVEIVTDATLVERVNGRLSTDERAALVKYVTALDQRWDDYFNRAPSQFPWELGVNSAIYRKHERRGYNEPPSWQLIVLHPTAGYEYVHDAKEKFKAALALETIGYFTHSVGASLAVVWADRADADHLGYGLALHWQNKVTIGVTHHGGAASRTAILVTPNVEKFVTTNVKRVRDILTRVH